MPRITIVRAPTTEVLPDQEVAEQLAAAVAQEEGKLSLRDFIAMVKISSLEVCYGAFQA